MAVTTLGKRTRSSNEPRKHPAFSAAVWEARTWRLTLASAGLTPGLDTPAKRTRRSPRSITESATKASLNAVDDVEDQENQEPTKDSQEEVEPTPTKSQSKRVLVANTVKSRKFKAALQISEIVANSP